MSALSCVSTTEVQSIQSQLSDIQVQVLQLQKQAPTESQIADLESGLAARIDSLGRSQADLRSDLGQMSEQIDQLQAKLQETNFRLNQLIQQISATNQELQAVRDMAEEARAQRPTPPSSVPVPGGDPASDHQALYDAAYDQYVAGSYDLALQSFTRYLASHPGTDLADNATYWIGECYYRQNKFQRAVEQFDLVLTRYEGSDRAASSLLKKGYAYLELGQRAQGVVQLQSVICGYAGTDEAVLARQRMDELGIDVNC